MIAFLGCLLLVLGQSAPQDRKVVSAGELFKTASPSVVASARSDVVVNSAITADLYKYASPDPRFSNIEMGFPRASGKLGALYFYPQSVTSWQIMKGRMPGTHYAKRKGENGAVLYSYQSQQRTVTILVDSQGNVVKAGVW